MKHYQILIIGGGTAGITIAAQLKRKDSKLQVAIIEPSEKHYYQPAWTLVGAGTFDFKETERNEEDYIPKDVDWIRDKATAINPAQSEVITASSGAFTYDYLIPVPGLIMVPELLPGLSEALDKGVVCSNYTDPEHTWEVLQNFQRWECCIYAAYYTDQMRRGSSKNHVSTRVLVPIVLSTI